VENAPDAEMHPIEGLLFPSASRFWRHVDLSGPGIRNVLPTTYASLATKRRAAKHSIRRATPLKRMLMPTSVPITHSLPDSQILQIITARTRVMVPSSRVPGKHRRCQFGRRGTLGGPSNSSIFLRVLSRPKWKIHSFQCRQLNENVSGLAGIRRRGQLVDLAVLQRHPAL